MPISQFLFLGIIGGIRVDFHNIILCGVYDPSQVRRQHVVFSALLGPQAGDADKNFQLQPK